MTYQEEKQVQMRRQSSRHAIALAMQARWEEAVEVNKHLIEQFPQDADAYNRLGKAYMELGEYAGAEEAYQRAVGLDPYNVIAKKNLNRLSHMAKPVVERQRDTNKAEPYHFIEETGKSRVFTLHRPASAEILARAISGNTVNLKVDGSSLIVEDSRGTYLGMIEPRYGQRLTQLINGGNRYTAAVVSSYDDNISVIIREVYRSPAQVDMLSFPGRRYEEVSTGVSDKVFRDTTEYGEAWSAGGDVAVDTEGGEAADEHEDADQGKPGHDEV
jgi:tetratricopeptide (TPR) repeat protein